jgi:hypothetical protein
MTALHESLRKQLEKTVIQARDVAEDGARAALDRLGVGAAKAYKGLTETEQELRRRLRARGRQLGDVRKTTDEQETRRLTSELAYEYWHRMLFARFLAENDLLMHPEAGVSVSLADCEELAAEEGLPNGWLLAERWAARMLPEIFRPADPLLQVPFAPEHERALEKLLEALPAETFRASDALGWVYQFWQAKRKDEVNKSGVKIGADELPAVTQLFTEPYMVHFLLDNTLGAWWMGRHPGEEPPVAFEYLRLLDDATPAAGTFDGWPKRAAELKVLDPCCGSGHFLVAAFLKLVPMRMREEGLTARDACDAVLRDNLHGLEIDPRCTQIAAFAVALTAWSYPQSGGFRSLGTLNIACAGLSITHSAETWASLAESDQAMRKGFERMHALFGHAPVLGSLIGPATTKQRDALESDLRDVAPAAIAMLAQSEIRRDADREQLGITAAGLSAAARLLFGQYTLVVTNVPYLGRDKQTAYLQAYCEKHYPLAKEDLAAVFLLRCLTFTVSGGSVALVTPQSWLFQANYVGLRAPLLRNRRIPFIARLGSGAFRSISGEVVNVALVELTNSLPESGDLVRGVDVQALVGPVTKAQALSTFPVRSLRQDDIAKNPDSIVSLDAIDRENLLGMYAQCFQGTSPGDSDRLVRFFWELDADDGWERFLSVPNGESPYSGRERVANWRLLESGFPGCAVRGSRAWGKNGIAIGQMSNLPAALYAGEKFSNSTPVIIPNDEAHLPALWAFISSGEFTLAMRRLNPKMSVDNGYVAKISWDAARWISAGAKQRLPEMRSADPTQWIFSGSVSDCDSPLQTAVGRALAFEWPEQDREPDLVSLHADRDGVMCLPPIGGEPAATDRLRNLLAAAYGPVWSVAKQAELLAVSGSPGVSLEEWLRDYFFVQHCALFHHRPFIWQIWDGRKDGFSALVNYHKLDAHNLQTLIYTYLGDWIGRQEAEAKAGKAGADLRLAAARGLQKKLELILEGEPPYDIFVRWKPIEQQPIGWKPDLNDGVRINIRPFVVADVLRMKPNIKWGKDRGKNRPGSLWGEDRFNSYEEYFPGKKLTNAMKLTAREKSAG